MSSILEMFDRVRINVLQFFVPIGSRFIFWLRRKLNLTVRCRQVQPPFPDPTEITANSANESSDGADVVQPGPGVNQMTQTVLQPPLYGSNIVAGTFSPRNYDDFTASLHRTSASSPPEFAYLFRNQNFSYISDTDAGTTTTNPETDSD